MQYFQAIDTALHVATQEVDKLFLGSASRTIYLQIYETQIFYVIINYLLYLNNNASLHQRFFTLVIATTKKKKRLDLKSTELI